MAVQQTFHLFRLASAKTPHVLWQPSFLGGLLEFGFAALDAPVVTDETALAFGLLVFAAKAHEHHASLSGLPCQLAMQRMHVIGGVAKSMQLPSRNSAACQNMQKKPPSYATTCTSASRHQKRNDGSYLTPLL